MKLNYRVPWYTLQDLECIHCPVSLSYNWRFYFNHTSINDKESEAETGEDCVHVNEAIFGNDS